MVGLCLGHVRRTLECENLAGVGGSKNGGRIRVGVRQVGCGVTRHGATLVITCPAEKPRARSHALANCDKPRTPRTVTADKYLGALGEIG